MPISRRAAGWTLLIALFMAGCADPPAAQAASGSGGAATAQPSEALGSIAGRVINEESIPIQGATIAAAEARREARSDEEGRFTFNDLEPGKATLLIDRLGYGTQTRRVEVVAGEITYANVTLIAIVIAQDPIHLAYPKTSLIHFDHSYVSEALVNQNINQSALNQLRCDPCQFVLQFPTGPLQIVTEAVWTPSGNAVTNQEIWHDFRKGWSDTAAGTSVCWSHNFNREKVVWTEPCVKLTKGIDKLKMHTHAAYTLPSYEHKFDTWITFAYNAELPEDFSALPPA